MRRFEFTEPMSTDEPNGSKIYAGLERAFVELMILDFNEPMAGR
jgi:hypothetical protein